MISTSASLIFFLPVVRSLAVPRDYPVWVNTSSGGLCVLPCPCPTSTLLKLQWLRVDLKHDGYVYDDRTAYMHPLYKGRVLLRGPQPHACDLELVNVSSSDSGLYECIALSRGPAGSRTDLKSRHAVELRVKDLSGGVNQDPQVEDHPPKGSHHRLIFFPLIILIIPLVFLLFVFAFRRRMPAPSPYPSV